MPRKRSWEPPEFEWTQLGPVPVEMAENIEDEGKRLAGQAEPYGRRITLDSELPEMAMRVVHFHEWIHIVLYDAGIHGLPEEYEEAVVHAMATALVAREDFHAERAKRKKRR